MDPIKEALTYDDVLLSPKYSKILPSETIIETKLSKNLNLKIPIISSAMDTVTESNMAIEIAKLGGIAMEINGHEWHKKTTPPSSDELTTKTLHYYETTIENFGVERCMFESNFPVEKISCSYTNLWNSFKKMTANYSIRERSYLFHDTASKVYKID